MKTFDWRLHRAAIIDGFVAVNLAFLSVDILLAHSYNGFSRWEEWIPFALSVVAPPILAWSLVHRIRSGAPSAYRSVNLVIGLIAILVGLAGATYHLESQFFQSFTLRSLVYTAPFIAPLAYAGLGGLLILDRWFGHARRGWAQWILFFALGGFFGNFILAVCDHAQNGFFHWSEWIPVYASALAVGALLAPLVVSVTQRFLLGVIGVMGLQIVVGVAGFLLHLHANTSIASASVMENFIYGAPIFAPLLFPNLALLGAFGAWDLRDKLSAS
jgi:hypothetical protein